MMKKLVLFASTVLTVTTMMASASRAECSLEKGEKGSVRILSNDFEALRIVGAEAEKCASATVKVTKNQTTEHKNLQVPALKTSPAQYTVAVIANNSIMPLLNEGLIRPLDDLVARYGQDLVPGQLIKINGKVMAIAFMGNGQHWIMRKDLLDKAGIAQPKSYEEVLAAAKVLKEKGLMKFPLIAGDKAGWHLAAEFINLYMGYGGEFFRAGSAAPAINNEKGIATLKMMKTMTEYMNPDHMTYDSDDVKKNLQSGKTAMANVWGSLVKGLLDTKETREDIAKAFVLTAAPTVGGGSVPAAALWWDGFSIAKNIPDADAEASFRAMVYAIRPEVGQKHAEVGAWLTKDYKPNPVLDGVRANIRAGAKPYPMLPYMGLLHTALGAELAEFMQGRESADAALKDVEAAYVASAKESGFLK